MIEKFQKILDSNKYSIIEKDNSIKIHPVDNNLVIPDQHVNIQEYDSKYFIFLVSRNEKKQVAEINVKDIDFSIAIAIVICKSNFEQPCQDLAFIRKIRELIKNNEIDNVEKLFKQEINNDFFSIENHKENNINLYRNGDRASVYYNKDYIVKEVKLSRAYVVLYNYVKLLEEFEPIYKELTNYLRVNKNNDYFELRKYYVFGEI
ncbi:hypothetical protein [Amphibacillus jilinensis]|uniref:hypothetical protein n=1 Tax=Amphibacillus jilinensis TaxID=1216008 RepID=UPI0002F111CA|nr:hypothetical protein [Amphibacillus jilinensis]